VVDGGGPYADPLPQALALTAIVITFGVSAYLLALVYRSWLLTRSDEVEDDVEDQRIAALASQTAVAQERARRTNDEPDEGDVE
jgi:multicomponent Na+:H+ antiporter subunit C